MGLDTLCQNESGDSGSLAAIILPETHDADALRARILDRFGISVGNGLGKLGGKVFRIGHLGDFNDLMLVGTLADAEMGLKEFGVPIAEAEVAATMKLLREGYAVDLTGRNPAKLCLTVLAWYP